MKFRIEITEQAKKLARDMSLDQALRQICCPHYPRSSFAGIDKDPKVRTALKQQFARCSAAGSVFFHPAPQAELRQAIGIFQRFCQQQGAPAPLICTDLEAGPGRMIGGGTRFPSLGGAAAAARRDGSQRLVYEMGRIAAIEGRELGYNWTLAPCLDILHNPDTPTVTTRSAGRDAASVIEYTTAYMQGCQDHGLIATGKHFPGDGYGLYDQHLTTPEMPLSKAEWDRSPGRVYRQLIAAGLMAIMPGHISFPALDKPDDFNGVYPPATLSERLLSELLRGELGFEGLIVSDAIDMGGFAGFTHRDDACARFWQAGGDILLFANPTEDFLCAIKDAIGRGLLCEETVYKRAERVLSLKEQIGLIPGGSVVDSFAPESLVQSEPVEHRRLAAEISQKALEVVRDRHHILPVRRVESKRVLHLLLFAQATEEEQAPVRRFSNHLEKYFGAVETIENPGPTGMAQKVRSGDYDLIICSLSSAYQFGTNVIRFSGAVARNLMRGWSHFGVPTVFVSHFHPLLHLEYQAVMDCVINTYGTQEAVLPHLCQLLTGDTYS